MSDIAIRVEGLGKQYRLGQRASYRRLTESLTDLATAPFRAIRQRIDASVKQGGTREPPDDGTFWALDDVSFEIKQGEVVGIVGRNGAGKSTLLKILSRITEPTKGDVWLHGRVASLLEVGTGFHPELSGRENIFLNGAILGMRRREILQKFDEIVAFSEVEKFLDTPVKHYSSGMYMRLAFSVAAHLEPEILLVDEVLAVGDVQFQRKCLTKINDIGKDGRTVIFVSHNIGAISTLCNKAIFLMNGLIHSQGQTKEIIHEYLTTVDRKNPSSSKLTINDGDKTATISSIEIIDRDNSPVTNLVVDKSFGIAFDFNVIEANANPQPCILLSTTDGIKLFQSICH